MNILCNSGATCGLKYWGKEGEETAREGTARKDFKPLKSFKQSEWIE